MEADLGPTSDHSVARIGKAFSLYPLQGGRYISAVNLKIGVFIKQVPDTNSKMALKDGKVDETGLKFVINPYDEFAIEEAVKTKELWAKSGATVEVVGILAGPKEASKALRDAFAVGIDRGIHVLDEQKRLWDPLATARVLARVASEEKFHVIFAGKQAVDSDSHAVATMVAEILKMPSVSVVSKLEWSGTEAVKVERDIDGGMKEIIQVQLPALLTANKGLNKMRLASLPNIRAAAKKEIKELPLPEIKNSWTLKAWTTPPERGAVQMISGANPAEQAAELLRLLRDEAKVI